MFEILKTDTFEQWLRRLRDRPAAARINARLRRASLGHLGDCKSVGEGISEMRVACGPGYRLYFTRKGSALSALAREAGVSREGLRKALSSSGNPSFALMLKIARALDLDLDLSLKPMHGSDERRLYGPS